MPSPLHIRIGKTDYYIREPLAENITQAENEVIAQYLPYIRELKDGQEMPEGYLVDQKYTMLIAAVERPHLSAKQLRKMPGKHFVALRNTIFQELHLDQQDDVFFPERDNPQITGDTDGRVPMVGRMDSETAEVERDPVVAGEQEMAGKRDGPKSPKPPERRPGIKSSSDNRQLTEG